MKTDKIKKKLILPVMILVVLFCTIFILFTKGYFTRLFNVVFYREAIVFKRDNNLWIMDADGKNQRQLTTYTEKESGLGYFFDVSKKGDVVYEGRFIPPGGGLRESNIYRLSLKDGRIQRLTNDNKSAFPRISPDGTKVAFVKQETKVSRDGLVASVYYEGIGFIDLNSGKEKRLVSREIATVLLIWCDNKKLVFSEHGSSAKTYIVDLEKGENTITIPDKSNFSAVDAYGEKILFTIFDLKKETLFIYNIKTRETHPLDRSVLDKETLREAYGKFSSDGKKIAYFIRIALTNDKISCSLWITDGDGKNAKKISHDFVAIRTVSWSKDGRKIFVEDVDIDSPGKYKDVIGVVDADGSNFKRIANNGSQPRWVLIPKITFAPGLVKIIVFMVIGIIAILLIFGMALLLRKVPKILKIQSRGKISLRGVFCTQCGKENSPTATFCTNCGHRIK